MILHLNCPCLFQPVTFLPADSQDYTQLLPRPSREKVSFPFVFFFLIQAESRGNSRGLRRRARVPAKSWGQHVLLTWAALHVCVTQTQTQTSFMNHNTAKKQRGLSLRKVLPLGIHQQLSHSSPLFPLCTLVFYTRLTSCWFEQIFVITVTPTHIPISPSFLWLLSRKGAASFPHSRKTEEKKTKKHQRWSFCCCRYRKGLIFTVSQLSWPSKSWM